MKSQSFQFFMDSLHEIRSFLFPFANCLQTIFRKTDIQRRWYDEKHDYGKSLLHWNFIFRIQREYWQKLRTEAASFIVVCRICRYNFLPILPCIKLAHTVPQCMQIWLLMTELWRVFNIVNSELLLPVEIKMLPNNLFHKIFIRGMFTVHPIIPSVRSVLFCSVRWGSTAAAAAELLTDWLILMLLLQLPRLLCAQIRVGNYYFAIDTTIHGEHHRGKRKRKRKSRRSSSGSATGKKIGKCLRKIPSSRWVYGYVFMSICWLTDWLTDERTERVPNFLDERQGGRWCN